MKIYKLSYFDEFNEIEEEEIFNDIDYSNEEIKGEYKKVLKNFVEKNKYKYKIIYKNKIYPLYNFYQFIENKNNKLVVKLICYNHILDIYKKINDFPLHDYFYFERLKNKRNINMYKYIDYLFYSSHEIKKLIYKINNEDKINIFGEEFVGNNGNKCSIIYIDKIIPLQSYFLIKDINEEDKKNKKFEILLSELEEISDRSYMFYNCESLVEFSNFVINNNEIKDNIKEGKNHFNSKEIEKFNNFYPNNIDENKINKNSSSSSKETFNFFRLEFDKIDKLKRNYYTRLNNMISMFSGCSSLISLPDISKWNTNSVNDMNSIFSRCSSLISLPDISIWNTNNVNYMNNMFEECTSLISLPDISKWNTINVNYMNNMFSRCSSLISLPDISKWNTINVNYMNHMFSECSSFITLPDISKWNTINVNDMNHIFFECSALISLPDISKWNTINVNNMISMFEGCSSLISLPDISKWNTNNISDINYMFSRCSSLISLPDISKWNTNNVNSITYMFSECSSLIYLPYISNCNRRNFANNDIDSN